MRDDQRRQMSWGTAVACFGLACVLATALAACDQTAPEPAAPPEAAQEEVPEEGSAHDLSVEDAEDGESTSAEDDGSFEAFAPECLDTNGDVTIHALSELKGEQLEAMLQQQEYSFDARNLLWVNKDGSVALAVVGKDGEELSDKEIAKLDCGSFEASVGYRIVTSKYNNVEKAFDGLVGKVMVCEDVAFAESSGVAVAYGPSMHRCLVFLSTSDDVICLTMYSEDAVAAGLFDADAGAELGATIDEVFEALAGRPVGSASE